RSSRTARFPDVFLSTWVYQPKCRRRGRRARRPHRHRARAPNSPSMASTTLPTNGSIRTRVPIPGGSNQMLRAGDRAAIVLKPETIRLGEIGERGNHDTDRCPLVARDREPSLIVGYSSDEGSRFDVRVNRVLAIGERYLVAIAAPASLNPI